MISFIETIAFSFLCALIRTYISNEQMIIVILCLCLYIIVFRDYNLNKSSLNI